MSVEASLPPTAAMVPKVRCDNRAAIYRGNFIRQVRGTMRALMALRVYRKRDDSVRRRDRVWACVARMIEGSQRLRVPSNRENRRPFKMVSAFFATFKLASKPLSRGLDPMDHSSTVCCRMQLLRRRNGQACQRNPDTSMAFVPDGRFALI
jgi:hypothetical protein